MWSHFIFCIKTQNIVDVFKMLWDLYKIFFLSAVQLQEQVSATQNKEFDPLGPLPHGWGKIF